jgi:hypothetical protein
MSHLERFIDFRLFVTSAKNKNELLENIIGKDVGINENEKSKECNLKKLFDRIEPGRPDLDKVRI